jgi:ABC-type sugar transport system ATPase subunit
MQAITKRFPGVLALFEVNFTVGQGEVVALIGENGAGKSTLMKIISGVYIVDAGEVIYKGKPVNFTNPRQAQAAGIATIYQELNQVPQLSITENIFLGSEITRGPVIDWAEMHRQARQLLAKLRLDVYPRTNLGRLGVGEQQTVEVAKALHYRAGLVECPGCQHRVRGPRPTGSNLKPTTLERTKKVAMFKYYCPGQ